MASLLGAKHYYDMAEELRSIADRMEIGACAETIKQIANDYELMGQAKAKIEDSKAKLQTPSDSAA